MFEKELNRYWKTVVDTIQDGVMIVDTDGIIISVNKGFETITGYVIDEVIGRPCSILNCNTCDVVRNDESRHWCLLFRKGNLAKQECVIMRKDGTYLYVLKNASVLKNDNGRVTGAVETITDITDLIDKEVQIETFRRELAAEDSFHGIIGASSTMQKVFDLIANAAYSDAPVIIYGESGTGKELVAGAIHYNSERSDNPLMVVNCSVFSESLLESELFGHVKGAFTGAIRDRIGRFEEAEGGTIFLDEISEINPFIQAKLLRVLQEKEVERVGESRTRQINIRILTATNKNLYSLIQTGHFREDLFYRLKVFTIFLPPLRKRKEDIPLLVNHFIDMYNQKTGKQIQGVSQAVMRIFMDYDWPGNVRELQNAIEHSYVLCTKEQIDIFDLPVEIRQLEYHSFNTSNYSMPIKTGSKGKNLTREILLDLLDECDWNKAEVARQVGLSRAAIWKYMKKWGIPLKKD